MLERLEGTPIALSPSFDSETTDYSATVPSSVFQIRLSPVASDSAATIQWRYGSEDDEDFEPVANGDRIRIFVGGSGIVIRLKVTAGDGTATKTYTVTVTIRGEDFFCGFPDLSGRSEVWSAVLTVGGSGNFGYSSRNYSNYGALSDTSFEYRGISYTIEELFEYDVSPANWIQIRLDETFPDSDRDRLRVHLCGDTFDLATARGNQLDHVYAWSDADPRLVQRDHGPGGAVGGKRRSGVRGRCDDNARRGGEHGGGHGLRHPRQRQGPRDALLQPGGDGRGVVRHRLEYGPAENQGGRGPTTTRRSRPTKSS